MDARDDERRDEETGGGNRNPLEVTGYVNDVETGQTQGAAEREERRDERAGDAQKSLEIHDIEKHRGRDAEAHDIGEAVELKPELTSAPETACDLPVHEIEEHGCEDQPGGRDKASVNRQNQRQHAAQQIPARDHIRRDFAEGDMPPTFHDFHVPSLPVQIDRPIHDHRF